MKLVVVIALVVAQTLRTGASINFLARSPPYLVLASGSKRVTTSVMSYFTRHKSTITPNIAHLSSNHRLFLCAVTQQSKSVKLDERRVRTIFGAMILWFAGPCELTPTAALDPVVKSTSTVPI